MEEDLTRSWCWKMAALRKPLFGKEKKNLVMFLVFPFMENVGN